MANPNLAEMPCPCCGSTANVRESTKTKKAYIMCSNPSCNFQGFARGKDSDAALRKHIKPAAAAPAPAAAPEANPEKETLEDWLNK